MTTPEPREPSRSQLKREAVMRGEPMPTQFPANEPEPRGKQSEQLNLVSKRGKTLRFNTLCKGDGSPLPGEISIEIEYANQSMNAALSAEETRKLSHWLPASPPLSDDEIRHEIVQRLTTQAYDILFAGEPESERDVRWKWVICEIRNMKSELAQARAEVAEAKERLAGCHPGALASANARRRALQQALDKSEAELAEARAEAAEAKRRLVFLRMKGIYVGTATEAGKEPYLAYVIEPGSELDDETALEKLRAAEAERDKYRIPLVECAGVLEALWASERDGTALCNHMKEGIKKSIELARQALGIDAALAQADK
jgi:hypothetical protein